MNDNSIEVVDHCKLLQGGLLQVITIDDQQVACVSLEKSEVGLMQRHMHGNKQHLPLIDEIRAAIGDSYRPTVVKFYKQAHTDIYRAKCHFEGTEGDIVIEASLAEGYIFACMFDVILLWCGELDRDVEIYDVYDPAKDEYDSTKGETTYVEKIYQAATASTDYDFTSHDESELILLREYAASPKVQDYEFAGKVNNLINQLQKTTSR